jgi:hypothetical protein
MAIVTLQDDNIMTLQLYQAVGPSWLAGAVAAYGTTSSSCTSSTRSATGCTRCSATGARAWKQTPWRSYTSWMWREEQSQRVSWLRVLPWPEQQPGVRRSCGCWCTEREWRADFWYFQKNTHILLVLLCLARQGQPLPCSCTPESEHRVLSAGLLFAGHLSHRALGLPELRCGAGWLVITTPVIVLRTFLLLNYKCNCLHKRTRRKHTLVARKVFPWVRKCSSVVER